MSRFVVLKNFPQFPKMRLHLREGLIYLARSRTAISEIPKERSIMVLMLVLLMVLGFGLLFALGQAPTAEGHLVLTPTNCLAPEPHPLNPDPILLQPLWSG